jgi:hypothetical protein
LQIQRPSGESSDIMNGFVNPAEGQTLLSFECANPIWGSTENPFDPERTCGGSSGGEAVMVNMRGSPIGWGNDSKLSISLSS